jgi:hypothetical protein
MRLILCLTAVALGLSACTPPIPESGDAGVGFQDYGTYVDGQRRAAAGPVTTVVPPATTGFSPAGVSAALDRADGTAAQGPATGALIGNPNDPNDPNRARGNAPAGIKVEGGEMAAPRSGGISDEQDFSAVSQRETIESDKARIEKNRAQYQVVQPGALPTRPGDTGPNIVEFALSTTNAPGQPTHKRSSFRATDQAANCARYASPDLAQEAFLAKGGPAKDKLGLDPDGDGFACAWDPRPFRAALR